jgi:hypothetical protein
MTTAFLGIIALAALPLALYVAWMLLWTAFAVTVYAVGGILDLCSWMGARLGRFAPYTVDAPRDK